MSQTEYEIETLEDLFAYQLEAVYDMEVKLVEALDEMATGATNDNLQKGFATHRDETREHVERVEDAFEALGRTPRQRDNPVVDGLLEEKATFDDRVRNDDLRNVHYLGAGMKTERIEITAYEGLLMTAEKADLDSAVTEPLEDNLENEEKTFRKLQGLATGSDLKALWNKLVG